MHIQRAYCVELDEVIGIYEARYHYFNQLPPRKRFQFLCSNELCRATNKTKVTGVNYDKLAEESAQFVKPHFRENTEHISECQWVELEIAQDELKEETGGDSGHRSPTSETRRRKKTSNIVDIFVPAATARGMDSTEEARFSGILPREKSDELERIPHRRGRIDALKKYLRENPNRTSFLENVVDSYLILEPDERRMARLKIGDSRRRSYRECFRPIRFYNRRANDEFIYFGNAWAKRVGPNYSLRFYEQAEVEGEKRLISLYIEKVKLDEYEHRAYLSEFLEKLVSRESRYATCYFYGLIQPSEKNQAFLDIKLDHFDNLVLRLK